MKKLKAPLLFTLPLLPVAAVAGYFTILYQLDMMGAALIDEAIRELGSVGALIAIYVVQTLVYAAVCGFVGYILADKTGLMKPIRFTKGPLITALGLSVIGGVLLSLDYWTFGLWIPGIREATDVTLSLQVILASVLYGGIVEELMLRLFFMSLIAWLLKLIFCRKKDELPQWVAVVANVIAAILFAAGHLPATMVLFGELTPLLLLRCFLYNGGLGLLFGWLYRKYGIQYSMLSHALMHIISKLIWFVLI